MQITITDTEIREIENRLNDEVKKFETDFVQFLYSEFKIEPTRFTSNEEARGFFKKFPKRPEMKIL